jgi:putative transposase
MTKAHRLEGYDYSTNGGYFITMCTHRRQAILTGECRDVADRELEDLPRRFDGVTLDCHVVMPDHAHAILIMNGCSSTLSIIVQAYKSITARKIRQRIQTERVWQRGFHDRIIRNEIQLAVLRKYIEQNPMPHAARGGHR